MFDQEQAEKPRTREEVAEQERNAVHPNLLRIANFGVALSGGLFLTCFIGSFVMFMNAREDTQSESTGSYHVSSFQVLQTYWQKGTIRSLRMGGGDSPTRAFARGTVEGREEWMDLIPYLTFIPQDRETVSRIVPDGTVLPVYYNPQLQGEYRVRLLGRVPPAEASRRWGVSFSAMGFWLYFQRGPCCSAACVCANSQLVCQSCKTGEDWNVSRIALLDGGEADADGGICSKLGGCCGRLRRCSSPCTFPLRLPTTRAS